MGQVCGKHNQFFETECRWCPPEPEKGEMRGRGLLQGLDGIMKGIYGGIFDGIHEPAKAMPPLPIANCLHDGALFDFGSVVSCAACGKILPSKPASALLEAAALAKLRHDWEVNSSLCKRCRLSGQELYGTSDPGICKGWGGSP